MRVVILSVEMRANGVNIVGRSENPLGMPGMVWYGRVYLKTLYQMALKCQNCGAVWKTTLANTARVSKAKNDTPPHNPCGQ